MESVEEGLNVTLSDLHFYIMWLAVLCTLACLMKDTTCHLFRPNYIKIFIFVLILFSGFTWTGHVSQLKNFPDFSHITDELQLLKSKHTLSKLQRDVYLEGTETFCLLLLMVVPRYQQYYEDTLKAFNRRVKELSSKSE